MTPPSTPLLDAIGPALLDWRAANAGRPFLACDPDTYNALTEEARRLTARNPQRPWEVAGLTMYAGYEVVVVLDVNGWEWRGWDGVVDWWGVCFHCGREVSNEGEQHAPDCPGGDDA